MRNTDGAESEARDWALAVRGDAEAFGRVFDVTKDMVFRHALRLCHSISDAEDITALTFFEAWRLRSRVRIVEGTIVPWLLRTATNFSHNQRRSLRRYRTAMSRIPVRPPMPDHADHVLHTVYPDGVSVAFGLLSARDRAVLTLCVLEDFTLQQAAEVLRVPVGTVKSRLYRAKNALARLVELQPDAPRSRVRKGALS